MRQFGSSAVPNVISHWNVIHMNSPVACISSKPEFLSLAFLSCLIISTIVNHFHEKGGSQFSDFLISPNQGTTWRASQ